jgi:6-pyruvoyltetrahydropterin/6-carboxytetrahydropterin synthase
LYKISKRIEIAGSHKLNLDYNSPCQNIHGHNWIITVFCKSETLNEKGMIIDFKLIKELIHNKLDHKHLNDVLNFNPTAENISKWIVEQVPNCYKATVQESEGNIAEYEI